MSNKEIRTRIQNKHDFEHNWVTTPDFIPKIAELIVYDAEVDPQGNAYTGVTLIGGKISIDGTTRDPYNYPRFKFGDGLTRVNDLPFVGTGVQPEPEEPEEPDPEPPEPVYYHYQVSLPFPKGVDGSTLLDEGLFAAVYSENYDGLSEYYTSDFDLVDNTYNNLFDYVGAYFKMSAELNYTDECILFDIETVSTDAESIGNCEFRILYGQQPGSSLNDAEMNLVGTIYSRGVNNFEATTTPAETISAEIAYSSDTYSVDIRGDEITQTIIYIYNEDENVYYLEEVPEIRVRNSGSSIVFEINKADIFSNTMYLNVTCSNEYNDPIAEYSVSISSNHEITIERQDSPTITTLYSNICTLDTYDGDLYVYLQDANDTGASGTLYTAACYDDYTVLELSGLTLTAYSQRYPLGIYFACQSDMASQHNGSKIEVCISSGSMGDTYYTLEIRSNELILTASDELYPGIPGDCSGGDCSGGDCGGGDCSGGDCGGGDCGGDNDWDCSNNWNTFFKGTTLSICPNAGDDVTVKLYLKNYDGSYSLIDQATTTVQSDSCFTGPQFTYAGCGYLNLFLTIHRDSETTEVTADMYAIQGDEFKVQLSTYYADAEGTFVAEY